MNDMQEFDHHNKSYRSDIDKAVAFSGQTHDFFTRVKADYLAEMLKSVRGDTASSEIRPLRVLDVGCGHGHIHPYVLRPGIELSGTDVAASVIDEARRTNTAVNYSVYDGERLPYPDRSFDFAFAIAVMHHVPPPQWPAFMQEMKRVVRPGGMIAIFEHNPLNPLTRWIVSTCPIDENAVLLGRRRLTSLAEQAGLEDIQARYILFLPFDGKPFRTFDRAIGWLPMGAQYYVAARIPA